MGPIFQTLWSFLWTHHTVYFGYWIHPQVDLSHITWSAAGLLTFHDELRRLGRLAGPGQTGLGHTATLTDSHGRLATNKSCWRTLRYYCEAGVAVARYRPNNKRGRLDVKCGMRSKPSHSVFQFSHEFRVTWRQIMCAFFCTNSQQFLQTLLFQFI